MKNSEDISFSIISHHQQNDCVRAINSFKEVFPNSKFIVTLNTDEEDKISELSLQNTEVIRNYKIKGFAENHNQAFKQCDTKFFCVLNPDTEMRYLADSFSLEKIFKSGYAACSPILYENNKIADGLRLFPTFMSFFNRFFLSKKVDVIDPIPGNRFDWMSGACIFFPSKIYYELGGFDPEFFMYCEDIDIFRRMSAKSYSFCCSSAFQINHYSNRESRRNIKSLIMHVKNACKIIIKLNFEGKKTKKGNVI